MSSQGPENRAIQRALVAVDAHLNRTDSVNEDRRSHQRSRIQQRVNVYVSTDPGEIPVEGWSYNISRGGLGFVAQEELAMGDVVLCMNPGSAEAIWMRARIRRSKEIIDAVFDYGVEFLGRADPLT